MMMWCDVSCKLNKSFIKCLFSKPVFIILLTSPSLFFIKLHMHQCSPSSYCLGLANSVTFLPIVAHFTPKKMDKIIKQHSFLCNYHLAGSLTNLTAVNKPRIPSTIYISSNLIRVLNPTLFSIKILLWNSLHVISRDQLKGVKLCCPLHS